MEKSSAYLIDKLLKKLKDLTNYKEEKNKTSFGINSSLFKKNTRISKLYK